MVARRIPGSKTTPPVHDMNIQATASQQASNRNAVQASFDFSVPAQAGAPCRRARAHLRETHPAVPTELVNKLAGDSDPDV
jgi:hypothetical protein